MNVELKIMYSLYKYIEIGERVQSTLTFNLGISLLLNMNKSMKHYFIKMCILFYYILINSFKKVAM